MSATTTMSARSTTMSVITADTSSHELQDLDRETEEPSRQGDEEEPTHIDSLPPTDRGHGAYMALACCTLAQAPIWGYAVSFGIFQDYYTHSAAFSASPGAIASIGACQQGIMYLMMPPAMVLLTRHPPLRRWCGPLGAVLTAASLIASAFLVPHSGGGGGSSSIAGLIVTQGVLYAVGCGLLFSPMALYVDEWWVERKGLAHGVMWAGKSAVGVAMPFVFSALLDRVGLRATLVSWAVASAVLTLPTLLFLRPRIPLQNASSSPPSSSSRARPVSFAFLRRSSFWMMQFGIVIQALGYMMPSTYLASYASSIGLPSMTGPILLALFAGASVPGSFIHGLLGDRMTSTKVILISSIGSALPVFLLWGLSRRLAVLIVFVLLYGFFAGGFSSTWSSMLHRIRQEDASADTSIVFGLLLGGRGVGFVLGGPVSGALLSSGGGLAGDAFGYATKYGPMMLFTGLTAVFGAWLSFWTLVRKAEWGCHRGRL